MSDINTDSPHIFEGTDKTFVKDVVEPSKDVPVLVDFWAPWCAPCKTLTPILERLVNAQEGKIKLVTINTDDEKGIARQLRVQGFPMVFAFKDGKPIDAFMGAKPQSFVAEFIEKQKARFESA